MPNTLFFTYFRAFGIAPKFLKDGFLRKPSAQKNLKTHGKISILSLDSPVGPKMPLEIPRMTPEGPEMPPETSQDDLPNPRDNTQDPKTPKKHGFGHFFLNSGESSGERGDNPIEQKWLSCDDVVQK